MRGILGTACMAAGLTAVAFFAAEARGSGCPDLSGTFAFNGVTADCKVLSPKEESYGFDEVLQGLPLPVDPVHRRLRLPEAGELTVRQEGCSFLRFDFAPADGMAAQTEGTLTLDPEEQTLRFGEDEAHQWVRQNEKRLRVKRKGIGDYSCMGAWCGKLYPPRTWWAFARLEDGSLRIRYEYRRSSVWGLLFLTVIPQFEHSELDCVLRPAR